MSNNPELLSILDSVPIQDLLATIRKRAKTGSKDVVSYIRAIFQGSSDRSDVSENRRFETFKCALSLLQLKDLSSSTTPDLLSLLLLKVDLFQTSNLVKLCETFVDDAKNYDKFNSQWLEIFSKVLSCLAHRDTIVYQSKDVSGSELRKNIIASLFSDDSDSSCLVQIASVLKDVDLSDEEISLVVERLLKILPSIDSIELPPFVYQLLLISSKRKCAHVLQAILSHFIEKDKQMQHLLYEGNDSEGLIDNQDHVDYRQMEGTAILMISVVCRHDQKVGKNFLLLLKKMLHKPQLILSPFTFSTALSLSKIHGNGDEIFDTLRKSIVAAFRHKETRQNSVWFRNLIQWDEDILKSVKEAVKCSKFGWDHVCQGLVRFGFVALDAFGPRCIGGNTTKGVCPEGCNLGSHIIRDTFKSHRLVRQEIFEQILNRIIAKSQKPVSHYIDILSQIVQSDPLFLLDVLPKLVEILDYLHFLSHSNAEKVLQSLAPLLKISAPLKDTLMLVLRKALFHRDIEARKVAVCGYLTILKKINFIGKVSLSQSQTSVSSHASSSMISTQVKADVYVSAGNPTSKTMCLEIMGLLKRALMQQSEIRQLLYEGLYDVILQNPSLKDIILELLLGQFEKYYNSDESEIPLHFAVCFQDHKNVVIMKEPLAHLITTVFLILFEGLNDIVDEEYDQSAQKMLENFMQKLVKRMLVADATDFHIGKDIDLDESPSENNLKIKLLLNIYESLLEYSFFQNTDFESADCEEFLKLFQKYKNVFDSTSKKKQQGKSSKSKAQAAHHLFSHVTLNFLSSVLEALFLDETFKHQEGLQVFRADSNFVITIVAACNQKFTKMGDTGQCDGFSRVMKNSFNHVVIIGKVILKTYSERDGLSSDFSSLEWSKLSGLFAEGLHCVFNYIYLHHKKNMKKFIINISNETCLSATEALQYILKSIQKSVMKLLSDTDDDSNLKECIPLLSVIKTLYIQFMAEFKEDIFKWIKQLCSQQVFQNVAVSKAFISLCFSLGHQNENFLEFLKEIAFDIRYHLGNIDPDESVNGSPKYEIITLDVSKNVLPVFFTNLEQCFDEIEWVLNFIKINALGGNESTELWNLYNRLSVEQGVCSRVSDVILIFYEVVQTGVTENLANNILKLVTRLYRIITSLSRYYLLLHKNKSSELHASFEKLVKLSNMKLTPQVYAFITFIQMLSGEGNNKKKKAKGNAGAFKAVQDVKTIPSLVFEIESYEKNLIILSKKYKKNLTNKMKLSTVRDFRINAAVVTTVLEQQENESMADTTADETNNDANVDVASAQNSSQNSSTHASPAKDESDDHMSVNGDSEEEEAQNENVPLNTSLNIFGEDVPVKKIEAKPKEIQLNLKRRRLGIRGNTKRT